jgi:hypothetical protein
VIQTSPPQTAKAGRTALLERLSLLQRDFDDAVQHLDAVKAIRVSSEMDETEAQLRALGDTR